MTPADRLLAWVIRGHAALLVLALPAVLLPTDVMAGWHGRLGIGPFPRAPLTEYLTRSLSAGYAVHGAVLLLLAADVRRYRPLITRVYELHVLFAAVMVGVDVFAGMPAWWTPGETGGVAGMAVLVLWLNRRAARADAP